MELFEAIKIIRRELKEEEIDWMTVEALCKRFNLNDTAFREKLLGRKPKALLKDFLLDIEWWKKRELKDKLENVIDETLRNKIKFIDRQDHTYFGTPAELIKDLVVAVKKHFN